VAAVAATTGRLPVPAIEDPWLADDPWLAEDPWWADDPKPPSRLEVFKAGRWDRASGDGGGFASGGVADDLPRARCWQGWPVMSGRRGWAGSAMTS
jgi:hypothetical protein